MKLAIVIPGFQAASHDWCIPAFTNLARSLAARNEVHVFALRYPARRANYDTGQVHVHALGGGQVLGKRIVGLSLGKLWADTLRSIAQEHSTGRFDAIVGIWATESGWLATQAAKNLGVQSLVHVAGGELVYFPSLRYGYLGRGVDSVLMNHTVALADRLTVPSRQMLSLLRNVFPGADQKAVRWPLGVDTTLFNRQAGTSRNTATFNFISVGSLIPVKYHTWLIRSLAALRRRRPDLEAKLTIAGDGPLMPHLQLLTRQIGLMGYVTSLGEVSHEELPSLYNEAQAFVLGSWHEAQCMALLEAMSCGLPWIAPPVGAAYDLEPDQDRHGRQSGIVVSERSILAMSQAMERIISLSDEERSGWGKQARVIVERDYDLEHQTERLQRLLVRLTETYSGR